MFKSYDVLIPVRFLIFMLQVLLSIAIFIHPEDNIDEALKREINENLVKPSFRIIMVVFFIIEAAELIILITGTTLFDNRVSVLQIFFHSICVLLLSWFNHEVWSSQNIWKELLIGGIIPILIEIAGLIKVCVSKRKLKQVI